MSWMMLAGFQVAGAKTGPRGGEAWKGQGQPDPTPKNHSRLRGDFSVLLQSPSQGTGGGRITDSAETGDRQNVIGIVLRIELRNVDARIFPVQTGDVRLVQRRAVLNPAGHARRGFENRRRAEDVSNGEDGGVGKVQI